MSIILRLIDNKNPDSLAVKLRRQRFEIFLKLVERVNVSDRPLRILDVGGTERFWETMGLLDNPKIEITLLNVMQAEVSYPNLISVAGNACDMSEFADDSFDIAFSNSVIEHVGKYPEQAKMAAEVKRVAKHYFLQTPNKDFPFEPHFMCVGFHFLPVNVRAWLLTKRGFGWHGKEKDFQSAKAMVESIQLLGKQEVKGLFPEAEMVGERFAFLTKSYIVYNG